MGHFSFNTASVDSELPTERLGPWPAMSSPTIRMDLRPTPSAAPPAAGCPAAVARHSNAPADMSQGVAPVQFMFLLQLQPEAAMGQR